MMGKKTNVGEQLLNDLGVETDRVRRVQIFFEPQSVTVAIVERYILLDENRTQTIKERYELVLKEVQDG